MERQTSSRLPAQLQLNLEGRGVADHGTGSEAVSGTAGQVVGQVSLAEEGTRAWEQELMERVAEEANLVEALGRVRANKGSAGIDQMSVAELRAWLSQRTHRAELRESKRLDCPRSRLSCFAKCLPLGIARCRAGTPGGVRGEEAQASPLSRLTKTVPARAPRRRGGGKRRRNEGIVSWV